MEICMLSEANQFNLFFVAHLTRVALGEQLLIAMAYAIFNSVLLSGVGKGREK